MLILQKSKKPYTTVRLYMGLLKIKMPFKIDTVTCPGEMCSHASWSVDETIGFTTK